jgi:hypothetical protein
MSFMSFAQARLHQLVATGRTRYAAEQSDDRSAFGSNERSPKRAGGPTIREAPGCAAAESSRCGSQGRSIGDIVTGEQGV